MQIQFASYWLDISTPKIMGIVNVTPDSFFDGGALLSGSKADLDLIIKHAQKMIASGADILDIGGESTRPGATPISVQEECDRVLPVVECLARELDVALSVDTSSPEVMVQAAALGVGLINDVRALERAGAMTAAASTGLPVCLMHMQGQPSTMQAMPSYGSVVADVREYLASRVQTCIENGISADKIILDPGFGFGKTDEHNIALLKSLPELAALGYPLLVGLSRKSMIGRLLGREIQGRLAGSLALAMVAAQNGANIIRVHDVAETADVLSMLKIINRYQ